MWKVSLEAQTVMFDFSFEGDIVIKQEKLEEMMPVPSLNVKQEHLDDSMSSNPMLSHSGGMFLEGCFFREPQRMILLLFPLHKTYRTSNKQGQD